MALKMSEQVKPTTIAPPTAVTAAPATTHANTAFLRSFPQVIFLLLWTDGATTLVQGAFAGLADANAAARALGLEQGVVFPEDDSAKDHERPLSWQTGEGTSAWVEVHAVAPKKIARLSVSSTSSSAPGGKLYQNEEADDEIDEVDEEGNYD